MNCRPVTTESLDDLTHFSEEHGKFRYCSCMRWRMRSKDYREAGKDGRVAALQMMVEAGIPVGVLGYVAGEPVGWCSMAPRETYRGLQHSRVLPPLEGDSVWSVVCFFLDRGCRRRGAMLDLLKGAVAYARSQGAHTVEGYPAEPGAGLYRFMGAIAAFEAAGFRDVTPAGQRRRVMRLALD